MPNRPKKVKRPWVPERKPFERHVSHQSFYNSTRWRRIAKQYKESNPLCVKCLENDIAEPAAVVAHITRIKAGGDPYDESNLQSLCHKCHNIKSAKERHGK